MKTIGDTIFQLIKTTINKSLLKKELEHDCSDINKYILLNLSKLWSLDNCIDPNNQNKDFFNLSSGKLFEYYSISLIDTKYWNIISWRSDKIQNLYNGNKDLKPQSNSYPDFIIEYTDDKSRNGFKKGDRIAIECKWTNSNQDRSLEDCAMRKLNSNNNHPYYPSNALYDGACCFYFAIGVGWKIINKTLKPEAVYFIPASEIQTNKISKFKIKRKPHFKKSESRISVESRDDERYNLKSNLKSDLERRKEIYEQIWPPQI